mgnify:CR=1 FL=1
MSMRLETTSSSILLVLGMACQAGAGELCVRAGMDADDIGLSGQRTEALWTTPALGGVSRVAFVGTREASPELSGVVPQERLELGGKVGGAWALGAIDLDLEAGFLAVERPESWGVSASAGWTFASGWKVSVSPGSNELEGVFAQGVCSNSVASRLDWSGERTWAQVGGRLEAREGGSVPEGSLPLTFPDNEIHQAWAWVAREVVPGVVVGASGSWADSREETRQATGRRNDTLLWLDVPYRSPHEEGALEAVLRLQRWGGKLETTWPVWSTSSRRVESPWIADSPWTYTIEHCGLAEVRAGWEGRAGRTSFGVEAYGRSRPYDSGAWFTDRAWNQFGISAWVGLPIPPSKETTP